MSQQLYVLDSERVVLGGVIQFPELYVELKSHIVSSDFSRDNSPIWSIIEQTIEMGEAPSPVTLARKLDSHGVKLNGITNYDYITSLTYLPISKGHVVEEAKSVKKFSILRKVYLNAEELKSDVLRMKDEPIDAIQQKVDAQLSKSLTMFDTKEKEAINLYERLPDFLIERGNSPVDDVGYKMPFQLWQDYYGGLRRGGLYFTASRSGQGKSTFLSYIADNVANVCNPDKNIKVLFLDTEMDEADQMTRLAATRIGCPFYLIDTGNWTKSEEWGPKMLKAIESLRKENRNLWFRQVSSMGTDDLVNFVKRWFFKHVGRDGDALIIYDYLKVLANDSDGRQPEWAVALHKMQKLKDLAVDLNAPLFTALQVNRSGTTTNKQSSEVVDDESVLSISGRIDWLVNFAGILRRKTPDEIAEDGGRDFGTHKLIPLKTRFQGRISSGHQDLVRVMQNGKVRYRQNYLCYDIDNFNVTEVADFRRIAELRGLMKVNKNDTTNAGII